MGYLTRREGGGGEAGTGGEVANKLRGALPPTAYRYHRPATAADRLCSDLLCFRCGGHTVFSTVNTGFYERLAPA